MLLYLQLSQLLLRMLCRGFPQLLYCTCMCKVGLSTAYVVSRIQSAMSWVFAPIRCLPLKVSCRACFYSLLPLRPMLFLSLRLSSKFCIEFRLWPFCLDVCTILAALFYPDYYILLCPHFFLKLGVICR